LSFIPIRHTTSKGRLRIGTILDPQFTRLGAFLRAFVEAAPHVETELRHGMSGDVLALVRELALQAECAAIDGDDARIRLRVERESLRHPAHAEKLQAALAALLGHAVALEVEAGAVGDTPARREQRLREQRQREAEALIRDDPLVRELTAQFKTARIVPGSIKPI